MPLTPEQFVRLWQTAPNKAEVVRRAGVSYAAVEKRAKYYRRKGIQLRSFRPHIPLNVE